MYCEVRRWDIGALLCIRCCPECTFGIFYESDTYKHLHGFTEDS